MDLELKNKDANSFNKNMANRLSGLFVDMFNKPESLTIFEYFQIIIKKDDRYIYIGVLMVIIGVIYKLYKVITN
jgi:hypothetical protein